MTDDQLDALLSALTSVEADPRLRDRVIGAVSIRDRSTWRRVGVSSRLVKRVGWVALPAAAVLLLAIGITWNAGHTLALPAVTGAPALAVMPRLAAVPAPADDAIVVRRAASRGTPFAPGEDDRWPYRLPALERSAPLAIGRMEPERIRHQEIEVQPITIAQLEFESLER